VALDPGEYLLRLRLQKGTVYAGLTEALHIYSGLTSAASMEFTDNDFVLEIGIGSATELAKIGADANYPLGGKYRITNDITLANWTPIGDNTAPFSGTIDGGGRTITLQSFDDPTRSYLGIFGYLSGSLTSKAEVKDLVVQSGVNQSSDPTTKQAIGILAGYAENTEFDNITLNGALTFESTKMIGLGGIAGIIKTGTVKDSEVSVDLVITYGTAGTNDGPALGYSFVGGVAGMFEGGAEITNCHNTGDIQAFSTVNGSQVFAGGIAGGSQYAMNTPYRGKIEDCSYTGDLHAKAMGFWTYAGGIAGTIVGGTVDDINFTTRIVRSFATGTISVAGTSSGNPYIGGIVGYNYYGALVSQSYFTGSVIADKTGDYTGGIAGYNSREATPYNSRIEDCWSSGTVTGFRNAGGIVGQNQAQTYLQRCFSTATVIATDTGATGVGGIAGFNSGGNPDGVVTGNVALNPLIQAGSTANIHRIVGRNTGTIGDNFAWSGMTVTTGGSYTPDIDADEVDGADITVQFTQADYVALGWDFSTVWEMGSYGYPKLIWPEDIAMPALE
jgi:hypothetical protein